MQIHCKERREKRVGTYRLKKAKYGIVFRDTQWLVQQDTQGGGGGCLRSQGTGLGGAGRLAWEQRTEGSAWLPRVSLPSGGRRLQGHSPYNNLLSQPVSCGFGYLCYKTAYKKRFSALLEIRDTKCWDILHHTKGPSTNSSSPCLCLLVLFPFGF